MVEGLIREEPGHEADAERAPPDVSRSAGGQTSDVGPAEATRIYRLRGERVSGPTPLAQDRGHCDAHRQWAFGIFGGAVPPADVDRGVPAPSVVDRPGAHALVPAR